jgi:hypothetical protein
VNDEYDDANAASRYSVRFTHFCLSIVHRKGRSINSIIKLIKQVKLSPLIYLVGTWNGYRDVKILIDYYCYLLNAV